jgi:hypothetical protein
MRILITVLAMFVLVSSADAQDVTQSRAYFPRQGWAYLGTSPDAPSMRLIFVLPAKAMCEPAVQATRQVPMSVTMSYTSCQPVALGQPPDEAWWLFSTMTAGQPSVTAWVGATEQAMCDQLRRIYAQKALTNNMRVGGVCQPASLKLAAAAQVAKPAHSLVATPQFPAQGWGYVQSSPDVPNMRLLSLHAGKAMCEVALHQERQTSRNARVSYSGCRPVTHGGGIDSGDWWVYYVVTPNPPMTSWIGATEQAACDDLRRSMVDPADPYSKHVRLGSCQRVTLRLN